MVQDTQDSKMNDKIWVYDIEVLSNFFSITLLNPVTQEVKVFVIHETRDDRKELLEFLNDKKVVKGMVGFNNLNYDYPVLHYLMTLRNINKASVLDLVKLIYSKSQEVIKSEYPAIRKPIVKQLDLYKLKHFDNDAKRTSLKWLEFAMNWENVQDMPLHYTHHVLKDEVDLILDYNLNDVRATNEFYKKCQPDIELRRELSKTYSIDLMNANDPKIGAETFAIHLAEDLGVSVYDLKQMRTERSEIKLKDCILPYIKFKSDEFNSLLDFFNSQVIKETKGAFKDIPVDKISCIRKYVNPSTINKNKLEILNVVFKGVQYDLGTGGLHANAASSIYVSDDEYMIIDLDVSSYYPNLSIQNGLRPEHLGLSFMNRYNDIYEKRKLIPKSNPLNAAFKLQLNGSYGKSNEKTSFFYDPLFTMSITISGQLTLLMLVEELLLRINDIDLLQANTDGVSVRIKRDHYDQLKDICKEWMDLTKLELEEAHYSKMIIRDVNNYIAVGLNNKVKLKGAFEIDRDWHKNHSMKIVPMALKEYFVNNIPIEETIYNSNDIFHFCKGAKSKGSNKLELQHYNEYGVIISEPLQKVNRYFISSDSNKILMKTMPPLAKLTETEKHKIKVNPNQSNIFDFVDDVKVEIDRESNIEAGYKVTIFNKYIEKQNIKDYNIDYSYYINECNKIINVIK